MFDHFINGVKNYANAKGRVPRKEFWSYMMFFSIFVFAPYLGAAVAYGNRSWGTAQLLALVFVVCFFGLVVPTVCMTIRRMHDTGRSGWFGMIPFANIVFAVEESKPGHNQYGPNPYGIDNPNFQDVYLNNYHNTNNTSGQLQGNNQHASQTLYNANNSVNADNYHNTNNATGQFQGNNPHTGQTPYSANKTVNRNDVNSEVPYSNGATSQADAISKLDEIKECAKLFETGLITQEEFDMMKKAILET